MNIAILQRDIVWADANENRNRIEATLSRCEKADLYVLPEMFTTGFCTRPQGVTEPADTPTLPWLSAMAAKYDCALAGSIAIEEKGKFYNRFCFVKPDGEMTFYNKRHLFTYGGEDKNYSAGHERVVVEYMGVRILLQICYDLRFPVFARNNGDYDLILYVANWPTSRIEVWDILLRARAIENQCFVVGVNRVGNDPVCPYTGHSVVIDAYGRTVAACTPEVECETYAAIDIESLTRFRQKFPVLNDRDEFALK